MLRTRQKSVAVRWAECEDWAHRWPHRDLNDEGEKLDEPIGHVGEGLRLAAVVGHLQK